MIHELDNELAIEESHFRDTEIFNGYEEYLKYIGIEVEEAEVKSMSAAEIDAAFLTFNEALNSSDDSKGALTVEKVRNNLEDYGAMIDFFMLYPDVLLDMITPVSSSFKLFPFQRVSLRAKMRKRQVFETATRGASKSWSAFASRIITCMLVPGHTSFVSTDVKEQAVSIAKEKVNDDLFVKFPLLANEMKKTRDAAGKLQDPMTGGKGYATYRFTSGSIFDVVGVDSARGKRRHSGLIEEVIEQDQTKINEKILPLMNISRRTRTGAFNPREPFNQQQLFVTSAGFMQTFAYDKMIEIMLNMVFDPDNYMMFAIDYRVPMRHGLIEERTIRDIRTSPSFTADSFEREYGSTWSGNLKGAAISIKALQKTRKKQIAEYKNQASNKEFYVVGADMAKDGSANTAISVIKVIPGQYSFRYVLVNGYTANTSDYEIVSNDIKRTAMKYAADLVVIDTNGVGAGIRDWINKPSIDEGTGETLPGFGIINPPKEISKDILKHRTNNIVFEIKAGGVSANAINQYFFSRIKSGHFHMLISNRDALSRFSTHKEFPYKPLREQQRILQPYQFCDKLEEELLNLDIEDTSLGSGNTYIKLKRRNGGIQKDLFSSVSYAMYGVATQIEHAHYKKKLKKKNSLSDYIMIN